ncbi:MAG: hypothetical protein QW680_09810 [Pyrobaculum sp.]
MCYPEPPYVFTDPSEVESAFRTVYLFEHLNRQLGCRFGCPVFKFAAQGHDINDLLRQLRALIAAWGHLCGIKCDEYENCAWRPCTRDLKDLIEAAKDYEDKINPDFAKAVIFHANYKPASYYKRSEYVYVGNECKLSSRTETELEKIIRCELDKKWLYYVLGGYLWPRLGRYDDVGGDYYDITLGLMIEYRWVCYPHYNSVIVPYLIEDDVLEIYTRSWDKALFLWLAFEGELGLHYREEYEYVLFQKKAEEYKDSPKLYEYYLKMAKEAKASGRILEEYKFKVTLRGNSAYRFAKAMLNLCNYYLNHPIYRGHIAEAHCIVAKSLRHLAEKAEPPLISEHLRQFWRIEAEKYGDVLYPVNSIIEALETGEYHEDLSPWNIKAKRIKE